MAVSLCYLALGAECFAFKKANVEKLTALHRYVDRVCTFNTGLSESENFVPHSVSDGDSANVRGLLCSDIADTCHSQGLIRTCLLKSLSYSAQRRIDSNMRSILRDLHSGSGDESVSLSLHANQLQDGAMTLPLPLSVAYLHLSFSYSSSSSSSCSLTSSFFPRHLRMLHCYYLPTWNCSLFSHLKQLTCLDVLGGNHGLVTIDEGSFANLPPSLTFLSMINFQQPSQFSLASFSSLSSLLFLRLSFLPSSLPPSLLSLELRRCDSMIGSLRPGLLPPSLLSLSLAGGYKGDFAVNVLPPNLQILNFECEYTGPPLCHHSLPPSLTRLHFPNVYTTKKPLLLCQCTSSCSSSSSSSSSSSPSSSSSSLSSFSVFPSLTQLCLPLQYRFPLDRRSFPVLNVNERNMHEYVQSQKIAALFKKAERRERERMRKQKSDRSADIESDSDSDSFPGNGDDLQLSDKNSNDQKRGLAYRLTEFLAEVGQKERQRNSKAKENN